MKEQKPSIHVLFCTLALLAACANTTTLDAVIAESLGPQSQTSPQTYVYECSDGTRFTARIEGEKIWLFLPNQTLSLPHVPSGSGAKYREGVIMFWSKGDEAMLEVGKKRHVHCKNNRAEAIWEDAKLRGVDFRAVGNEPGWHLELTAGEKVVFVGDYGTTRQEFATPEPIIDQSTRSTTYRIQDGKHDLVILIQGQGCHDSMSGDPFETTVTVILDGKKYRGCGKALH